MPFSLVDRSGFTEGQRQSRLPGPLVHVPGNAALRIRVAPQPLGQQPLPLAFQDLSAGRTGSEPRRPGPPVRASRSVVCCRLLEQRLMTIVLSRQEPQDQRSWQSPGFVLVSIEPCLLRPFERETDGELFFAGIPPDVPDVDHLGVGEHRVLLDLVEDLVEAGLARALCRSPSRCRSRSRPGWWPRRTLPPGTPASARAGS